MSNVNIFVFIQYELKYFQYLKMKYSVKNVFHF